MRPQRAGDDDGHQAHRPGVLAEFGQVAADELDQGHEARRGADRLWCTTTSTDTLCSRTPACALTRSHSTVWRVSERLRTAAS